MFGKAKLKPCPLCGGKVKMKYSRFADHRECRDWYVQIYCDGTVDTPACDMTLTMRLKAPRRRNQKQWVRDAVEKIWN